MSSKQPRPSATYRAARRSIQKGVKKIHELLISPR
jgi:hypothetical protein